MLKWHWCSVPYLCWLTSYVGLSQSGPSLVRVRSCTHSALCPLLGVEPACLSYEVCLSRWLERRTCNPAKLGPLRVGWFGFDRAKRLRFAPRCSPQSPLRRPQRRAAVYTSCRPPYRAFITVYFRWAALPISFLTRQATRSFHRNCPSRGPTTMISPCLSHTCEFLHRFGSSWSPVPRWRLPQLARDIYVLRNLEIVLSFCMIRL